jgi:dihydrodipicolinate synthase/N-acetylneuraminate lyase
VSIRRELSGLWSRCDSFRRQLEQCSGVSGSAARRQLDALIDELASALLRLGTAGAFTPTQLHDLETALSSLVSARAGRLPLDLAVAHYASTLETMAAQFHILLCEPCGEQRV